MRLSTPSADHLWQEPWQTDTCIGDWFYNRSRFTDRSYRSAAEVLQRLADVVSKNGNLLGYGPVDHRRDGSGLWLDLPRGLGIVPAVRIEGWGIVPA